MQLGAGNGIGFRKPVKFLFKGFLENLEIWTCPADENGRALVG
jgi:hypothetical protein